jgi:hypothetical protein
VEAAVCKAGKAVVAAFCKPWTLGSKPHEQAIKKTINPKINTHRFLCIAFLLIYIYFILIIPFFLRITRGSAVLRRSDSPHAAGDKKIIGVVEGEAEVKICRDTGFDSFL